MKKQERADYILRELDKYYPTTPIPLHHTDAFTLLIAVLLSAQCTDERVNQVTPILFEKAPNVYAMNALEQEEIQTIIRPCGLSPTKSKNIKKLCQLLIENHAGEVPESLQELEALPGVGHKTASVVMSQWFGHPAFPVDTHIHRLAQNWKLTNGKSVDQTEKDLKKLFPVKSWNKLHLQIIFYGREYCTARGCRGLVCPICTYLFPKRKKPIIKK